MLNLQLKLKIIWNNLIIITTTIEEMIQQKLISLNN